jgi:hypothetical protein
MHGKRMILLTTIAFSLIGLLSDSAFSQNVSGPRGFSKQVTTEEVVQAGNKSIIEGDWVNAESNFRKAVRLEPKQPLWQIQVVFALGHQKRWKEAFAEIEPLIRLDAVEWLLSVNQKMPDGKIAFLNTETFRDEKLGIIRYLKAVKEGKNVASIASDVGNKLEEFCKKNKIAMTYDISKFRDRPFEGGDTIDITSDFIAYYNERHQD